MPKNSMHTFKNIGNKSSRKLITIAPSGFETFFSRCEAEFQKANPPNVQVILQIGAEHGIHFLPP
ncbi:MAG TPA: hypothetical protein VL171_07630 [Verrucomicrobiae bacterium]|nr:hypothetical protein [Verrucomicrobiae bacterium]